MRLFIDHRGGARTVTCGRGVLLLLATAVLAFSQSANTAKFELADVHASPHTLRPQSAGPFYGDGRYELQSVNLLDLIHTAYGIDPERVYGGPNWLEIERFDVTAKAPSGSNGESRKLMLQALLADRFKLVFHNDSKPMPAFGLTVAKSGKLQESDDRAVESGCNFKVESAPPPPPPPTPGGAPPTVAIPTLSYTCHGVTMAAFAANISSIPAGPILDSKPVVDQTALKGVYDFTIRYTPTIPAGVSVNVTGQQQPFNDVIERELGLKLQPTTAPLPVITVDSAQKPGPNPPEVAKAFPPPPSEFDVAELKPSAPVLPGGGRGGNIPEVKNGRVIVPGITLQNLIQVAWQLNSPDELVGAPKWLNSDQFDLVAKAPAGVALGDLMAQNNRSMPINLKALAPMIRSLLVERFKLTVHTEQRPMEAYTLVAVKPRLQKADPSARTRWNEGPGSDGKDPRKATPILGRLVTCQNVTMAQFAELLPGIAPGYIHTEVLDKTGLEGGWDFTLSFSGNGFQTIGGGGGRGGDGPPSAQSSSAAEASDPSGGLSLLDALQKQVGLKLEMQKRPYPVLVIDHIEQKPVDK